MNNSKLVLFAALILLLTRTAIGYGQMDCTVLWSQHSLDWSHFQPADSTTGNQKAFSSIGITYTAEIKNDHPSVQFAPYFISEESWVLDGEGSSNLLAHEQRMFDLAEVYARKMRETIALYMAANGLTHNMSDILVHVRNTYKDMTNELLEKIRLYNCETNYGKNVKMQQKWNKTIDADLKRLAVFASEN